MKLLNTFVSYGFNFNPISRQFESLSEERNYIARHAMLFKAAAFTIAVFGAIFTFFGAMILFKSHQMLYLPVFSMGAGSCLMSFGMRLQVAKDKYSMPRFKMGKDAAHLGWRMVVVSGILSILGVISMTVTV